MASFPPSRPMLWVSYGLSALTVLFLLVDAGISMLAPHLLADAQAQVGFPADLSPLIGVIALACAIMFAIPRTATLGAILITGFVGGVICTHLRVGEIGSPPQFIAMALAAITWLSLWLRDDDLRRALKVGSAQP
jgi:hypothetical protein